MIIKPKSKGFICTTAHPAGCVRSVQEQIEYIRTKPPVQGPKKVLIIGASTGYGLASRIVSAFGCGASTVGVAFERPAANNKTASAGWYNTEAFETAAHAAGYYAKSINGDAFSTAIKQATIALIQQDLGQVDMVIYSLAAPRRVHPLTGETMVSALKPIGEAFTSKNADFHAQTVSELTVEPAAAEEVRQTIGVMGGEDWEMWIEALQAARVLASGALTVSYSYIGPDITRPIYRDGTIGKAKESLEASAEKLDALLRPSGGRAFVSVNKALVTQASAAIPGMVLYISLLYKVMKDKRIHENCIEQIYRLFQEKLFAGQVPLDERGRIRADDWEMREDVQREIQALWQAVSSDNVVQLTDIIGYHDEFFRLFGFGLAGIDYNADVDI